ncbi:hypothetical protein NAPIS_ORF00346, partial [Vairimorpha apis BRL 01]
NDNIIVDNKYNYINTDNINISGNTNYNDSDNINRDIRDNYNIDNNIHINNIDNNIHTNKHTNINIYKNIDNINNNKNNILSFLGLNKGKLYYISKIQKNEILEKDKPLKNITNRKLKNITNRKDNSNIKNNINRKDNSNIKNNINNSLYRYINKYSNIREENTNCTRRSFINEVKEENVVKEEDTGKDFLCSNIYNSIIKEGDNIERDINNRYIDNTNIDNNDKPFSMDNNNKLNVDTTSIKLDIENNNIDNTNIDNNKSNIDNNKSNIENTNIDKNTLPFDRITTEDKDNQILIISTQHLSKDKLHKKLENIKCDRVVVFCGSGWNDKTYSYHWEKKDGQIIKKGIEIIHVPYSEHSSSDELEYFKRNVSYNRIVNTVKNKKVNEYE